MANRMGGAENLVVEWCLCEKLPRAMLHIPMTRDLRCEVCGLMRKVRRALSSSSSSDEDAMEERQKMLLERRRAEEAYSGPIRVKVGFTAKKPNSNCLTCGGLPNPRGKVYAGRFGRCLKPKRLGKREETSAFHELATAPPPSSPSSSSFQTLPETMWDSPNEDMPNLVAMAHEVFKRPVQQRSRWPSYYNNLFVSDFIPLDSPITDPSGGAISKRRVLGSRPLRTHRSRPLPPLAKVLSEIVSEREMPIQRAKGGGLVPTRDPNCSNLASQFTPYDQYEGPSEDSLMVNSAQFLMHQLNIKSQLNLSSTHLATFADSELTTVNTPTMSSAPPLADVSVQRVQGHQFRYVRGRRLHLREEVGKAASQTVLSDNSSSSKSSSSSDSSTRSIPQHIFSYQNELDDQALEGKPNLDDEDYHEEGINTYTTSKTASSVISIMDEIFWTPIEKVEMTEEEGTTDNSPNQNVECKLDIENDMLNDQTNKPKDSAKYYYVLPRKCNKSCTLNGNEYGCFTTTSTSSSEKLKDNPSTTYLTAKECTKIEPCEKCGRYRQMDKLRQTTTVESIKTISINKIPINVHKYNGTRPSKSQLNNVRRENRELGGGTVPSEGRQKTEVKETNCFKLQNICGKCNKRSTLTASKTIIPHTHSCQFHSCAKSSNSSLELRKSIKKSPEQLKIIDDKSKENTTIIPKIQSDICEIEPKVNLTKPKTKPYISHINTRIEFRETRLDQLNAGNLLSQNARRLKEPREYIKNSFEIVRHSCTEMIIPKMVVCSRDISGTAVFITSKLVEIKEPITSLMGIHEFRTPDILPAKDLEKTSSCSCDTPPAQNQIKDSKKLLPVWPAHPFKYRKHKMKYQEMKFIYKPSDQEEIIEHSQQSNIFVENVCKVQYESEDSSRNKEDGVMQQLKEMMVKPIKLIVSEKNNSKTSCTEETGKQNPEGDYAKEQKIHLNISKNKIQLLTEVVPVRESDMEYFVKPEVVPCFRQLPSPLYRKDKLYIRSCRH